jgi:hypothetical protein
VADQPDGQVEAAAHAPGVRADRAVGRPSELEPHQQLGSAVLDLDPVQVVQAADHVEVLAAGEVPIDRGGLAGQTDGLAHGGGLAGHVVPGHLGLAGVGAQQGGEDADGGALAGTVGAEQPEHGAGRDGQVQVVQGLDRPEVLAEALGLDRQVSHGSSTIVVIDSDATYEVG